MLILKIKAGESVLSDDDIGDIHVAMLASSQFRVYINNGMLPDGSDDAHFDTCSAAFNFALEVASCITHEYYSRPGECDDISWIGN